MSFKYRDPQTINSPASHEVKVIEVIFDGGKNPECSEDPNYSIAIIQWDGDLRIGMRWNISAEEWGDLEKQNGTKKCMGNPQSRSHPTWFVLPNDNEFALQWETANQRLDELKNELE